MTDNGDIYQIDKFKGSSGISRIYHVTDQKTEILFDGNFDDKQSSLNILKTIIYKIPCDKIEKLERFIINTLTVNNTSTHATLFDSEITSRRIIIINFDL